MLSVKFFEQNVSRYRIHLFRLLLLLLSDINHVNAGMYR